MVFLLIQILTQIQQNKPNCLVSKKKTDLRTQVGIVGIAKKTLTHQNSLMGM